MRTIYINTDGGSRGNPGPAAIGVVIKETETLKEISEYIGETTNNQAEYQAVLAALKWIKDNLDSDLRIEAKLDSQLVVEQLNGNYKMKNEGLKPLFWQIRDLVMALGGNVHFQYVPREQNKEADALVNLALDEHENNPSNKLGVGEDK